MDSRTGDIYSSLEEALKAGVPEKDLIEVRGDGIAIKRVSEASKILNEMFPKVKRWGSL